MSWSSCDVTSSISGGRQPDHSQALGRAVRLVVLVLVVSGWWRVAATRSGTAAVAGVVVDVLVGVIAHRAADLDVLVDDLVVPDAGQLRVERVGAAPDLDLVPDRADDRVVEVAVDDLGDPADHLTRGHLDVLAADGQHLGAEADPGGVRRVARLVRDGARARGDSGLVQRFGDLSAAEVGMGVGEVDHEAVVVGPAADHLEAGRDHVVGHGLGAQHDALHARLELRRHGLAQHDGLGEDLAEVGPALELGEAGAVDGRGQRLAELVVGVLAGDDHASTRTVEGLVRGHGEHVEAEGQGVRVHAGGDQAGDVRDVRDQDGADLVRDLLERGVVRNPAVRAEAHDDDLGAVLAGDAPDLVHVDPTVRAHSVADDVEHLAHDAGVGTVGEVAAVAEAGAHDGDVQLGGGRLVRDEVGAAAAPGLHVGDDLDALGPEDLAGAGAGQVFDEVDVLAAGVVALAGQAFAVLVADGRALRLEDGQGGSLLTGDEVDDEALAPQLCEQVGEGRGVLLAQVLEGIGTGHRETPDGRTRTGGCRFWLG